MRELKESTGAIFRCFCLVILAQLIVVEAINTFNYEIADHVRTVLRDFLRDVSRTTAQPASALSRRTTPSIDDEVFFVRNQYFDTLNTFGINGSLTSLYMALESNGRFLCYTLFPVSFEISYISSDTYGYYRKNQPLSIYFFDTDVFGAPIDFHGRRFGLFNFTFDPRGRPWYVPTKAARRAMWSALYIDAFTGQPCLTFATPAFKRTVDGRGDISLFGVVAADVLLGGINGFLVQNYKGSQKVVFILDANSGYIVGNSLGLPNYEVDADGTIVSST
jgi:hypothetical protein